MEFARKFAGKFDLKHMIGNAAGTARTPSEVEELAKSEAAFITIGSFTRNGREGNNGDNYYDGGSFSLNSIGLRNVGIDNKPDKDGNLLYQNAPIKEMKDIARAADKPLIVSVAGEVGDFPILAKRAFEEGADAVELNFGCPNEWEGERQKEIISYDHHAVRGILYAVEREVGKDACIGVKLSPLDIQSTIHKVGNAIGHSPIVKFVVCVNTLAGSFAFREDGKPALGVSGGFGGMAGPNLKPKALGVLIQLRAYLQKEFPHRQIDFMGIGGITTGLDVLDFLQAGATTVAVATAYIRRQQRDGRGGMIFSDLLGELVDVIEKRKVE